MKHDFERELVAQGLSVKRETSDLAAAAIDFGHIETGDPSGVITIESNEDLQRVFRLARDHREKLTLRTYGNSQNGQSIPVDGYTVDMSQLRSLGNPDAASLTIECEASASWRSVVDKTMEHGMVPLVVPLNLDLSVGGTLSAGGVGASSHLYGRCAENVSSLTVVTGGGELLKCTHNQHPEAFLAALGGQGRCVAIVAATLKLRRASKRVRTKYVLYPSLSDCLSDMVRFLHETSFTYTEAFCSSSFQGLRVTEAGRRPLFRWFFGAQFTQDIESDSPDDGLEFPVESSRYEVLHVETDSHLAFLARYDVRFEQMRRTGEWSGPHPWFECFLPLETAGQLVSQALTMLPPYFGNAHRLYAIRAGSDLSYLQLPTNKDGVCVAFAVLPTSVPRHTLNDALKVMNELNGLVAQAGGKRYLSGWLGPSYDWKGHYGEHYDHWVKTKQHLDPHSILSSRQFGNSSQG